jgi:signal transduction histidine kinase
LLTSISLIKYFSHAFQLSTMRLFSNSITECAKHQKVLVDDVLMISKLEVNRVDIQQVPFFPKDIITRVATMFNTQVTSKNLLLSVHCKSENWAVKGDPEKITQVVINLVSNAVKFTEKGTITISLLQNGNSMEIEVQVYCLLNLNIRILVSA